MFNNFKYAIIFLAIFFCNSAYAENKDEPFVGILMDKKTCKNAPKGFLPLPMVQNESAMFDFIMSRIDQSFGKSCKVDGVALAGFISQKSFATVKLAYKVFGSRKKSDSTYNHLYLDSTGGLLIEAMKIGDFIAEKNTKAYVANGRKCYSSCVFVLAAASIRSGIGKVGIHRPFSYEISTENLSYSQYIKKYDKITFAMKNYLGKYGISPALVDQINVVSSDDIRILNDQEREKLGLGFKNIASTEFNKAQTIQICGKDYYNLHIKFHKTIQACRDKLKMDALEEWVQGSPCFKHAKKTFPNYSEEFDKCKALKEKQQ